MRMNHEERRQKRQQDTKKATITLLILLLLVLAVVIGVVVAVKKFAPEKEEQQKETETVNQIETEIQSESEEPQAQPDPLMEQAAQFTAGMTLEDKVAQMFFVTPDALTGYSGVTAAGDTTKEFYQSRPVGGIIYMAENLKDTEQTSTMLTNMKAISQERTGLLPFLGVDEEGGAVARIAGNSAFGVSNVGNMSDIGATGDAQNAYNAGTVIGTYLHQLGFNLDFAPVADVLTNPDNTAIGNRSFGSDAQMVSEMVTSELAGLSSQGIYGVVKHFPGHGGTTGDSHDGAVTLEDGLEELTAQELVPFKSAIESGVSFVMVGHIAVPNVIGDDTPASLSSMMITDILRNQMGYEGIVITDGMNMGAITANYTADQAAVMAISAGADIILMPQDYETAYNGVLQALQSGTITEERINESVTRIVRVKLEMAAQQ